MGAKFDRNSPFPEVKPQAAEQGLEALKIGRSPEMDGVFRQVGFPIGIKDPSEPTRIFLSVSPSADHSADGVVDVKVGGPFAYENGKSSLGMQFLTHRSTATDQEVGAHNGHHVDTYLRLNVENGRTVSPDRVKI